MISLPIVRQEGLLSCWPRKTKNMGESHNTEAERCFTYQESSVSPLARKPKTPKIYRCREARENEVISRLGNYYRKFIKNFSKVASPLSNLLGMEGQVLNWNEECNKTFLELKTLLSIVGVLKDLEFDKEFEVHTNTSGFVIGGVLMQDGHPVAYESWKLMGSQSRWLIHEKKLYVVIYCLKSWRYYVDVVRHYHFDGCRVDLQTGTGQFSAGCAKSSTRFDYSSNTYASLGRAQRGGERFSQRRRRNNETRRGCGYGQLFLRRPRLEEESSGSMAYEELTKERRPSLLQANATLYPKGELKK